MPPFRPPALNHPYDDHRPQPPPQRPFNADYGTHDRPNPNYGDSGPSVPPNTHLEYGYGYGYGYGGHDTEYINGNFFVTEIN